MERQADERIVRFRTYLESQIATQRNRPYSEKEDIERTLGIYEEVKRVYAETFPIGGDGSLYETPLSELDLPAITRNALMKNKITCVEQLTEKTEWDLRVMKGLGELGLTRVKGELAARSLSLRGG